MYMVDTKVMERIRFLCSMGQFVVTDTCEQTAKGTSGYYKVVFIALSTIVTKFSLNP